MNKFYSVSDKSARVYFLYSFLGGETMRFFSYGRKSVFSDKSDSIDNQFRMNREYCESKFSGQVDSWQQFSDEDFTGANTSRPDLQRMLSFIKGGFCDVLTAIFCINISDRRRWSLIVQRALNMCALLRMNFWLKCHNYHQKPAEIFVQITVINNLNSTGIRANIQTT